MNVFVMCVIVVLGELALHWMPWQLILGRRLPRLAAYVLGMLAIVGPLTGLFWGDLVVLTALWSAVASAGAAVYLGWGIDYVAHRVRLSHELQELLDEQRRSEAQE